MASPFEIIALAETIAGVGSKVWKFLSNLKNAPHEIRELCIELELLRSVLERIGITSAYAFKTSPSSHQAFGLETVFTCLKLCETELNTLWLAISPLRSDPGLEWGYIINKTKKSVASVLKADEIEKASRRIDRMKQTLLLGMSMSGIAAGAEISEGLSSVEAHIEAHGVLVMAQAEKFKETILAHMQQLEHRFLQKVDELSSFAATQHEEGSLRISQLSQDFSSVTPTMDDKNIPTTREFEYMEGVAEAETPMNSRAYGPDWTKSVEQALPRVDPAPRVNNQDEPSPVPNSLDGLLSPDVKGYLQQTSAETSFGDLTNMLQEASQNYIESGSSKKLLFNSKSSFLNNLSGFERMFSFIEPEYSSILRGGLSVILQAANRVQMFNTVTEALKQMAEALRMCERELTLYPEQRVRELCNELYKEILSGATSSVKILQTSSLRQTMKGMLSPEPQETIMKDTSTRIKSLSKKVIREVEYLHRRELREAHQRLREVDRKQDGVLRMLKEQQRILVNLQDEQKLLAMVADHQKVLQLLQQLLARQGER